MCMCGIRLTSHLANPSCTSTAHENINAASGSNVSALYSMAFALDQAYICSHHATLCMMLIS